MTVWLRDMDAHILGQVKRCYGSHKWECPDEVHAFILKPRVDCAETGFYDSFDYLNDCVDLPGIAEHGESLPATGRFGVRDSGRGVPGKKSVGNCVKLKPKHCLPDSGRQDDPGTFSQEL